MARLATLAGVCAVALLFAAGGVSAQAGSLSSSAFAFNGYIPTQYTCDANPGPEVSPPLSWTPVQTGYWALDMIDTSAGNFVHWFWWDLGAQTTSLPPGADMGALGASVGMNDFGMPAYGGPCPPQPCQSHTYVFTLYALEFPLNLQDGATYQQFLNAKQSIVSAQFQYQGLYPPCGIVVSPPPPPPPPPPQPPPPPPPIGVTPDDVADQDQDGVPDKSDNCPAVANHEQQNIDRDAEGDACDLDNDNDGIKDQGGMERCDSGFTVDCRDNCRLVPNPTQDDRNDNGVGDACEEAAPGVPRPEVTADADRDGVLDVDDNCSAQPNADQTNRDGDAQGDACDDDQDGDGVQDHSATGFSDNCPLVPNFEQKDTDHDGQGDSCDKVQNVAISAVDVPEGTGRPAGFEPTAKGPDLWVLLAVGGASGVLIGAVAGVILWARRGQR